MLSIGFKTALVGVLLLLAAQAWAGNAYWIDVRTPDEYAAGHVDGAVNIPYEVIGEHIGEVTKDHDALIYVYCRSGRRSGIAMNTLNQAGYSNVVNLGGLQDAEKKAASLKTCPKGSPADC